MWNWEISHERDNEKEVSETFADWSIAICLKHSSDQIPVGRGQQAKRQAASEVSKQQWQTKLQSMINAECPYTVIQRNARYNWFVAMELLI